MKRCGGGPLYGRCSRTSGEPFGAARRWPIGRGRFLFAFISFFLWFFPSASVRSDLAPPDFHCLHVPPQEQVRCIAQDPAGWQAYQRALKQYQDQQRRTWSKAVSPPARGSTQVPGYPAFVPQHPPVWGDPSAWREQHEQQMARARELAEQFRLKREQEEEAWKRQLEQRKEEARRLAEERQARQAALQREQALKQEQQRQEAAARQQALALERQRREEQRKQELAQQQERARQEAILRQQEEQARQAEYRRQQAERQRAQELARQQEEELRMESARQEQAALEEDFFTLQRTFRWCVLYYVAGAILFLRSPVYRAATEPALTHFREWPHRTLLLMSGFALLLWLRLVFFVDTPSSWSHFWVIALGLFSLPALWYLPMVTVLGVFFIAYTFAGHGRKLPAMERSDRQPYSKAVRSLPEEDMTENEQEREGEIMPDEGRQRQPAPASGFVPGIFDFLGNISVFPFVNQWNEAKLDAATRLLEKSTKLVHIYTDHQRAQKECSELPETLRTDEERRTHERRGTVRQAETNATQNDWELQQMKNAHKEAQIRGVQLDRSYQEASAQSASEPPPKPQNRYDRKREEILTGIREERKTKKMILEEMEREIQAVKNRRNGPLTKEDKKEIQDITEYYRDKIARMPP